MERLTERLNIAEKALATLKENEIFSRMPAHVESLDIWLSSMKTRMNPR